MATFNPHDIVFDNAVATMTSEGITVSADMATAFRAGAENIALKKRIAQLEAELDELKNANLRALEASRRD